MKMYFQSIAPPQIFVLLEGERFDARLVVITANQTSHATAAPRVHFSCRLFSNHVVRFAQHLHRGAP